MATMRRRPVHRRTGLRWAIPVIGFFVFLLAVTWERIALKEARGRIEKLEMQLQSLETDEQLLRTQREQESSFITVHQVASREWGMSVATPGQRAQVAPGSRGNVVETAALVGDPQTFVARVARALKGGVAQAHSAEAEGGDGKRAR